MVGEDGKTVNTIYIHFQCGNIANYSVILLVQTFCFRDKAVCREVEQLEVQCNNNEAGCKWVGKLIHYVKVLVAYGILHYYNIIIIL